jgi:Asp-tRNA(Asn)/Glu-tRNA(Gln) amidotransferase C subunit
MIDAESVEKKRIRKFVEQMALLVNLQLRDEYKDGVVTNFERIKAIAEVVNEFDLPENIEAGSVFQP